MADISVHLLNSFVRFAGAKNISEAARDLGITQPALSKQLALLERQMAESLFVTRGRRKALSPYGEILYARLKVQIGNLQEIILETKNLQSNERSAKIRIVGRRGVLDRFSTRVSFSGCLTFSESSNEFAIKEVLELKADIGLTHYLPSTHDLVAKKLFREEFQLVIPKKLHPKKPEIGRGLIQDLLKIPCLAYKPNDELIRNFVEFYSGNFSEVQLKRSTENYLSLSEMCEEKIGWALLPVYLTSNQANNWILPVAERVLPSRQFYLVYRPEFRKVSWFAGLLEEIQKCFER